MGFWIVLLVGRIVYVRVGSVVFSHLILYDCFIRWVRALSLGRLLAVVALDVVMLMTIGIVRIVIVFVLVQGMVALGLGLVLVVLALDVVVLDVVALGMVLLVVVTLDVIRFKRACERIFGIEL